MIPALKRGHSVEFALTDVDIEILIQTCRDKRTRAMILLASLGLPMRGIVKFKGISSLIRTGAKGEGYALISDALEGDVTLTPKQFQFLSLFPEGFGVTNVTIWRRIRRAIMEAKEEGLLNYPDDKVPFPEALAFRVLRKRLHDCPTCRCVE